MNSQKKVVVSLSTIPPRLNDILPTLESLYNQSHKPHAIELYLPRKYKRFDFDPKQVPSFPDWVDVVIIDEDLGPATKVLPATKKWRGQDVEIVFCDDDHIYHENFLASMLNERKQHPNDCITNFGWEIEKLTPYFYEKENQPRVKTAKKGLVYRIIRTISLGQAKPNRLIEGGYVDVLEGWAGAMVQPDFFDDGAFDIPDILWSVDDVWLSGYMAKSGINIWVLPKSIPPKQRRAARIAALNDFATDDHNRKQANTACVKYFRDVYGIWK